MYLSIYFSFMVRVRTSCSIRVQMHVDCRFLSKSTQNTEGCCVVVMIILMLIFSRSKRQPQFLSLLKEGSFQRCGIGACFYPLLGDLELEGRRRAEICTCHYSQPDKLSGDWSYRSFSRPDL